MGILNNIANVIASFGGSNQNGASGSDPYKPHARGVIGLPVTRGSVIGSTQAATKQGDIQNPNRTQSTAYSRYMEKTNQYIANPNGSAETVNVLPEYFDHNVNHLNDSNVVPANQGAGLIIY